MVSAIKISPQGIKLIAGFEGFKSFPYKDPGGIWTIGYGTVIPENSESTYSYGITKPEALHILQDHIEGEYAVLESSQLPELLQHQQDAVLSLVYNIGAERFLQSTIYDKICIRSTDLSSWLWYVKDAKGTADPGLVKRRAEELQLFIYGYPTM